MYQPALFFIAINGMEAINNTDANLFRHECSTYTYYATGNRVMQGTIPVAMHAGSMREILEAYFPTGVPTIMFDAKERKYGYLQLRKGQVLS